MANKIEKLALAIGEDVGKAEGIYVVDVSYKKTDGKNVLCFYIDKAGGVGIDDCESFSRAVEDELDKCDPIESEYSLEVSSPGVDRQLKTERELRYYTGRRVDVKLYKAADGKKELSGTLIGYENENAVIEADGKRAIISVKDAAYIRLHFEF